MFSRWAAALTVSPSLSGTRKMLSTSDRETSMEFKPFFLKSR